MRTISFMRRQLATHTKAGDIWIAWNGECIKTLMNSTGSRFVKILTEDGRTGIIHKHVLARNYWRFLP